MPIYSVTNSVFWQWFSEMHTRPQGNMLQTDRVLWYNATRWNNARCSNVVKAIGQRDTADLFGCCGPSWLACWQFFTFFGRLDMDKLPDVDRFLLPLGAALSARTFCGPCRHRPEREIVFPLPVRVWVCISQQCFIFFFFLKLHCVFSLAKLMWADSVWRYR